MQRRLAAIMAVGVIGSSRLVELGEVSASASIHFVLDDGVRPSAGHHGGRTAGRRLRC